MSIRTDLAVEAREMYQKSNKGDVPGVYIKEYNEGECKITDVEILNEEGEKNLGKPKGKYITIDMPEFVFYDKDTMIVVSEVLGSVLSGMVSLEKSMTALVVGLGNWNVTPDALGPKVISQIMITRHLKQLIPDEIDENIRPVCGMSPGVLGITGIETSEIIKSIVKKIKPNLVICVDALASRKASRVNRTIQIGNTGISPGSGVGNKRMEISERTIGIPVIAVGVPTVVDAATLANDTIDLAIDQMIHQSNTGGEFYNMLKAINKDEKQKLINEILNPYLGDLMVTPKDVDLIIDNTSKIIANGINLALQPAMKLDEISKYLN
ncbi:GPR endopeptidase [Clostridium grantii]|uniref:Germination protease n=1 Tax=Clostridium grantii DSM 8605 TaxID=1121316 RepID=A0A1M5XKM6_9CLOT|nr:GPR endopeptidase [Clostridium grantii]SHI00289.1 spore protease [Clostridium grantii DSM 8605]